MDSLFAIKGKDFVMVAADAYSAYSIIRLKNTEDKVSHVDGNKLMAVAGPIGDRTQFGEYIKRNIHLHHIRHGVALSTSAAANFARAELAEFLRQNPFQVNILFAGCDENKGPQLYWIDWLASMVELQKAAHGYASNFLLGLLDRYYKPDLSEEEALDIMKKCIHELKTRFLLSQADFMIKVVKREGITVLPMDMASSATVA